MKIINITHDDYANFQHENANALRSIGVNCLDFKLVPHAFNYESESRVVSQSEMIEEIKYADVIQIFHSDLTVLELVKLCDYKNKKLIVYHTGSRYRSRPEYFNKIFNPIIYASFTDQCEFMSLGAKNLKYVATAIDCSKIKHFGHQIKEPYIIGHFPSNAEVKGTEKIKEMLSQVSWHEQLFSTEIVIHKEQYIRMDKCDIYIELFKPELNGKPYGCYGVTAFEAAAAGKIVITQNLNEEVYFKAYGFCPFIICNTEKDFIKEVNRLLSLSPLTLSLIQTQTYNWVSEVHNYESTGKYILDHIK